MRPLGLEPKTYGLKVCGDTSNSTGDSRDFEAVVHKMVHSPDLMRVIEAWESLPVQIKRAIVALIGE
jgi:hypothetical protein